MRRLGTSSCPWRPVRSLRPPPSSGQRTTSSSATAPGSKWRQRAERNQNCFYWGFFSARLVPSETPDCENSLSVCLFVCFTPGFYCLFSSKLTFTNPDKDDLGRYSVVVTDTDGVSASHTLTEDGTASGFITSQGPSIIIITAGPRYAHVLSVFLLQLWTPCWSSAMPSDTPVSPRTMFHPLVTQWKHCCSFLSFFCTHIEELFFCLFAVVPLKHGLNYEVLEKGHVRFWVQAVKLSSSVNYRFIVNDKEVAAGEVFYPRLIFFSSKVSEVTENTCLTDVDFCLFVFSSSGL